jgi:ArsR family metal-binding transcriptional regulator/predicted Fe-Mo cluster-binding NifX family protein
VLTLVEVKTGRSVRVATRNEVIKRNQESNSEDTHGRMAAPTADCRVLLARGMGMGAYESLQQAGIRPVVTHVADNDAAAQAYLAGTLTNHFERLHGSVVTFAVGREERDAMTDAPLVSAITLIRTLPCLADPGKIIVIGETDAALDGVLPLLNAILPNVVSYHPFSGVMTLRRRPGLITLYPDKVMITQVADVEEGLALLAAMRDLLNQTWARREEIQPRHTARRVPRPLDVYELLPRTNCRACGEATCMAFAFGLLESRHRPAECPSLADLAFVAQRQALGQMLDQAEEGAGERNRNAL